ncbi:hypothetical protein [Nocardioides rubriscoriae]|uniref:hypothetical protein n=1 Tax=Nocardioides rubriscoriae TaxID=642762 RepID=UPI001B881814|nr:hypothetical protein [Nocardioides rubriscoriae]
MDPATVAPPRVITEPVDRGLLALLRRAVLAHATSEPRRVFPPAVHVGVPGASSVVLTLGDQRLDHALRTDALEAMARRARAPSAASTLVWLTRPGDPLETRDVDLAWSAAARSAAAELGRPLPMVVVGRRSWCDPVSGVHRAWVRLRRAETHDPVGHATGPRGQAGEAG